MQKWEIEQINEAEKLQKIKISLQETVEFVDKNFLDLCGDKYGYKVDLLQGQLDVYKAIISQINKWIINDDILFLFLFRNWCYDKIYECIDELCKQTDLKSYIKGKIIAYIYTIELINQTYKDNKNVV